MPTLPNEIISWIPNAGAASLVVSVVILFLKEIKNNRQLQKEEQEALFQQRTAERLQDHTHFKDTLGDLRGEMINARNDFKTLLSEQRTDFSSQLSKMTSEFHDRHENLQNQVVGLVKDNNLVGIQMSKAITEVRDEIRLLKSERTV